MVQDRIKWCTAELKGERDREARREMRAHIAALGEQIETFNQARREDIADFRAKQGVWVDG